MTLKRAPRDPGVEEVTVEQALELAQRAHDAISSAEHLPHALAVDGGEGRPGDG